MATGRTSPRYVQLYQNGIDLTGETRSVGAIAWDADFADDSALNWEMKGGICGRPSVTFGQVNTILRFDTTPTASPMDIIKGWDQTLATVMVPVGIRATAAVGDPVAMLSLWQKSSAVVPGDGLSTVTIDYEKAAQNASATVLAFENPWGVLAHAKGAETAANTATGYDGLAQTTTGAWMMAQIFACAGAGTVTITLQDAATNLNASFAAVTSLTTGAIGNAAIPCAVWAQTTTTATIRQFTRWQISLSGITSCTFALSYGRGR